MNLFFYRRFSGTIAYWSPRSFFFRAAGCAGDVFFSMAEALPLRKFQLLPINHWMTLL